MVRTRWNRMKQVLLSGKPVSWQEGNSRYEILIFDALYGKEYSFRNCTSGNTIEVTFSLESIANLIID